MKKYVVLKLGINDNGDENVFQGIPGSFDTPKQALDAFMTSGECAYKSVSYEDDGTGTYVVKGNTRIDSTIEAYIVPITM